MEYFEWSSDEMMQEFKNVLIERAKAGVKVRILYDPLGCLLMLKQKYVQEMNAGGVHMLPWAPLYNLHTISYRSHRKIVVIDSKVGYTGGLNMTEEYLNGPKSGDYGIWRDTHMRVTGEVVLGLQASFAVQWYNTTAEELTTADYYPPLAEIPTYLPLQIVNSGPDSEWKAIRRLYFGLITGARDHIYLQSPYFILDEGLLEALANAARSGVDVKVMIAADGPGGSFPYWAGFTYAANVARAGVKVYFYMKGYLHAKTIAVDSAICSIGSANLDIRSFRINYELNLIIYDEKTTRELEADFNEDLKECEPFVLADYRKSNIVGRARDSFFRLLSPLL
jgi:cardiolipin synthase